MISLPFLFLFPKLIVSNRHLSGNKLKEINSTSVQRLERLRFLWLDRNALRSIPTSFFCEWMPRLRSLYVFLPNLLHLHSFPFLFPCVFHFVSHFCDFPSSYDLSSFLTSVSLSCLHLWVRETNHYSFLKSLLSASLFPFLTSFDCVLSDSYTESLP